MGKSLKFWILAFAIAGFSFALYSNIPQQGPPEPMTKQSQGNGRGPCGIIDKDKPGNGPGIPPPVGLCLPINDYLLPLLLSGIVLGSIMVWRMEKIRPEEKI